MAVTPNEQKALHILADCPIGATRDALLARGVKPATLEQLVWAGTITTRTAVMANPKGMEVVWYALASK
jgi:hypothetical protein